MSLRLSSLLTPAAAVATLLLSGCFSPAYLKASQESLHRCNPLEGQPDCQDGRRVDPREYTFEPGADYARIEDLYGRYERAVGAADASSYAALFTEDAVIEAPSTVIQGREQILSKLEQPDSIPPVARTPHVITNVVIDLDGGKATATATWIEVDKGSAGGEPRIHSIGRYEDQYVRRHGQWLIARRRIVVS